MGKANTRQKDPPKGIREWDTSYGVHVLRIHYTADPDKDPDTHRGALWLKSELVGYPQGMDDPRWRREMEIDWDAYAGQLLFPYLVNPEYQRAILVNPLENIPDGWRLTAGLDYGARNPSALVVTAWDFENRPLTVWEYYEHPQDQEESIEAFKLRKGYRRLADGIKKCPWFHRINGKIIADQSIYNKSQETERGLKSLAALLAEEGVNLMQGARGGDIAWYEMVNDYYWQNPAKPLWRITKNCTWLFWELQNLRFAEWSPASQEVHNLKDEVVDKDNHAVDAVRYDMLFWNRKPTTVDPAASGSAIAGQIVDFVSGKSKVIPIDGYRNRRQNLYADFG